MEKKVMDTESASDYTSEFSDQQLNYHLGCAVKYICRAGHKDSKEQDIEKAIHYLQNELQHTYAESELDGSSGRVPSSVFSLPERY